MMIPARVSPNSVRVLSSLGVKVKHPIFRAEEIDFLENRGNDRGFSITLPIGEIEKVKSLIETGKLILSRDERVTSPSDLARVCGYETSLVEVGTYSLG